MASPFETNPFPELNFDNILSPEERLKMARIDMFDAVKAYLNDDSLDTATHFQPPLNAYVTQFNNIIYEELFDEPPTEDTIEYTNSKHSVADTIDIALVLMAMERQRVEAFLVENSKAEISYEERLRHFQDEDQTMKRLLTSLIPDEIYPLCMYTFAARLTQQLYRHEIVDLDLGFGTALSEETGDTQDSNENN